MTDSPPPPILHLPKSACHIRPFHAHESEYTTLSNAANNPLIAKNMRNAFPHPYTPADSQRWIAFTHAQPVTTDFVIALSSTNELIGAIGLKLKTDVSYRTVELGYWIAEGYWGKGIAGEAVERFCQWVWSEEQWGHVLRIEAEVFDGNDGSRRVLEKAGFECEGRKRRAAEKNGVVLDVWGYALLRAE
ncbi:acyl-CoA N-acyltransferase [Aspergillus karnatakaensis]|uniref:GNAT family N-acetyltransferase n=1 Tax=Aspergillus karnatakaensis TaxID=1810916 RepID=UPI003CCD9D6B